LLRRSEYWSRTRGRVNDHHREAPSGFVWNDIESEVFGGDCALYAAGLSCEEDATTSSWGDGGSSLAHAAGRKVSWGYLWIGWVTHGAQRQPWLVVEGLYGRPWMDCGGG
jgi:hypothetical protein